MDAFVDSHIMHGHNHTSAAIIYQEWEHRDTSKAGKTKMSAIAPYLPTSCSEELTLPTGQDLYDSFLKYELELIAKRCQCEVCMHAKKTFI